MLTPDEFEEVEALVRDFRNRMGIPDDIRPNMFDLLIRMRFAGEIADIITQPASTLGASAATFDPSANTITVQEESVKRQNARDRFTYAHEIGHRLANHKHVRHRKANGSRQFGKDVSPDEAMANAIAATILIPAYLAQVDQSTTADDLVRRFGVSHVMAERRLLDLQRQQRVALGLKRALPTQTTREAFDTGDYASTMAEMAANARRWNR